MFKKIVGGLLGLCIDLTVSKIIKNNARPETKLEKVAIAVGSYAIGWAVADKVSDYVVNDIEETMKDIKKFTSEIEIETTVSVDTDDEELYDSDYEVK